MWQCQMEVCPLSACTRTPRAGRATLRVAGKVRSASRGQTCAGGSPFFLARRAGLKDTHAHGIHARLPERVRARGFRESYRILRPAKHPADNTRARAGTRTLRRLSSPGEDVGFISLLEVLICPHLFREPERPSAPRNANQIPCFIRKPRAFCSVMFAVR